MQAKPAHSSGVCCPLRIALFQCCLDEIVQLLRSEWFFQVAGQVGPEIQPDASTLVGAQVVWPGRDTQHRKVAQSRIAFEHPEKHPAVQAGPHKVLSDQVNGLRVQDHPGFIAAMGCQCVIAFSRQDQLDEIKHLWLIVEAEDVYH